MPESSDSAAPLLLALTTEASAARAEVLADALLARGLAACVALSPVRSSYHWQGALESSEEVQLLIKSHPSLLPQLEEAVHRLHSYSTPEWIHWRAACSPAYGSWLAASCGLSPDAASPAPPGCPGDGAPAG
jgi:periplasmic divalent cation tolerance protein